MNTVLSVEIPEEIGRMASSRDVALSSFVGDILKNFLNDEMLYGNLSKFEPNEETLAAIAEAKEGKCRAYDSIDALLADVSD